MNNDPVIATLADGHVALAEIGAASAASLSASCYHPPAMTTHLQENEPMPASLRSRLWLELV